MRDGQVAALIAAAGEGSRLGRGPKALLRVGGSTLLERTADAFRGEVDEVVVALPPELITEALGLVPEVRLIEGGSSRQETVLRLLQATSAEWVLVHDVARPFLPVEVIRRVLAAARHHGAATAAVAVPDTLFDTRRQSTVEREDVRAIQTPQGFRRTLLLEAHGEALRSGTTATDDAGLVRGLGRAVGLAEGSRLLFKITSEEDLELAEALAARLDVVP